MILVYCRSGNRSRQAAQKLADMGYTNVYEFGGLLTWPGKIITTEEEAAVVDEELKVTHSRERRIASFGLYRYGELAYDSYTITLWPDGYHVSVNEGEEQYISDEAVDALYRIIEEYHLEAWDGFDESDYNVLDGEYFRREIQLTDDTRITANGDNVFPERYFEVAGRMHSILRDAETWPMPAQEQAAE